jgi:hypothetical protein
MKGSEEGNGLEPLNRNLEPWRSVVTAVVLPTNMAFLLEPPCT